MRISFKSLLICCSVLALAACSGGPSKSSRINYKGQINDPIMAIALLSEQQYEWAGTPYRIGGQSRSGVDCSGFVRTTFFDRFGIKLPRQTKDQANYGQYIEKGDIQTGDLVF
ncbi:endopeptidase, partial [Aggregatibacter actinomycetemcomitans serotype a str. H5P1]